MKSMMRAIVKSEAAPGAVLLSVPIPLVARGSVLVEILATAICGTDLHIYDWTEWAQARIHTPMVFGHEFCGRVVEIGDGVTGLNVGDLIAGETHIPCGECRQCRTGLQHVCQNMKILGVHTRAPFSELRWLPQRVHGACPPAQILMLEPYTSPSEWLPCDIDRRLAGKSVAVFGCGPIGLYAVAIARASGAGMVVASEVGKYRRDLAATIGATHVIDPTDRAADERIMELTHGCGVDVAIELSGNPAALRQALSSITRGGRLSIAGLPSRPVEINVVDDVIYKELRIYGITGRVMYDTWYRVANLIESGVVDPRLSPLMFSSRTTSLVPWIRLEAGLQAKSCFHGGRHMGAKVAVLHTVQSTLKPISEVFGKVAPDAQVVNLLDDSLLRDTAAAGRITPQVIQRICCYYACAQQLGGTAS